MNTHTPDGGMTLYGVLKSMLDYLDENEPTADWKHEHIEFVESTARTFLLPEFISPWNEDKAYRKLINETSVLARHLFSEIHSTHTFDTEVFRIIGNNFIKMCDTCLEENSLVDAFAKMNCS